MGVPRIYLFVSNVTIFSRSWERGFSWEEFVVVLGNSLSLSPGGISCRPWERFVDVSGSDLCFFFRE